MADEPLDERARRRIASELAEDLRAVIANLGQCAVPDADLRAAAELGASLRERVQGPPRPRWYENDAMALSDGDRVAYLEQSPLRGRVNPIAPPLVLRVVESEGGERRVSGHARLGAAYEGPPRGVHGGWVAAMMDELLGTAQGLAERQGVTAKLTVRFRHVTPLDEELRFESWVAEDRGRFLIARGTCHAEGIFARVDFNEVHARMRARRDGD